MVPRDPSHCVTLSFDYADERRARVVARSVGVEAGEIDDDRSGTTVRRDGTVVEVTVTAADLVAMRAGVNIWVRLVSVAERTADVPT